MLKISSYLNKSAIWVKKKAGHRDATAQDDTISESKITHPQKGNIFKEETAVKSLY